MKQEDLINYGLIPELVGRLPIFSSLKNLNKDDLLRVLLEPKNSLIKQYQKLFLLEGVVLEFEKGALSQIVDKAYNKKSGARGLRSVMEESLMDVMYKIPDQKNLDRVTITEGFIKNKSEPIYKIGDNKKTA